MTRRADRQLAFRRARPTCEPPCVSATRRESGGTDGPDLDAVAEAEQALARAERRYADLKTIAAELDVRKDAPGRSISNLHVEKAVSAVVAAHPVVRRLAADYHTAKRAFHTYEATLILLRRRAASLPT